MPPDGSGPDLYVAVYHASPTERLRPDHPDKTAIAFDGAVTSGTFPYDIGDDPAFFSAAYHHGPVTWGVCRPDVRGAIRPGDWVAFLSCQHHPADSGTRVYRFVACLPVATKLSQTGLFAASMDCPYRSYLDLLLRPTGAGWEHHEPGLHVKDWHDDWLWRLCDPRALRNGHCVRKEHVVEASRLFAPGGPFLIDGRPVPIADNYVVFSKSSALIAQNPPVVATYRRGEREETWEADDRSFRLRRLLFGSGSERGLRTANRQQPHRHFRRRLDDPSWPAAVADALRDTSFKTQAPIGPPSGAGGVLPADFEGSPGSNRPPTRERKILRCS